MAQTAPAQKAAVAQQSQAAQKSAAPAKSPEEVARLAARMELLLKAWEQRSSQVKELDAAFTRQDKSPAWQEESEYQGRALLKSPDLAFLNFDKLEPVKKTYSHYERIICTGKEVFHYQTASKQIFIYPLNAEERARALEEGPLPFLFNMKADKAKQRYKMELFSEKDNYAWIQIFPLEKIDQETFSKVYVQLNTQRFLPDRLIIFAPNGKDTQDYKFSTIKMNSGIAANNFEGVLPKGWDVVRNPSAGQQPAPGATNQPVPRVGRLTPGVSNPNAAPGATQPGLGGVRSSLSPSANTPAKTTRR
jgi:TIGR03009 family protein